MIINISYDANISDEDFETLKSEFEANSDEEFIGFYKGLIKAQSTDAIRIKNIQVMIKDEKDKISSINLN